ncbi:type I restriction enzyme HsdR N-terminal domain-containing protein [Candidimonas humi]|uniref:Type I restriction endonuclease n=1 Tax=Candidimonas humi TaxID=683355 RepID=A0ABV8P234_9BURK|nr:type I restriction endonuclease [Candidimonas humi]MBV6306520.1 type I restriction enzyme HsdR N-terminal domain-containing protein [Candidimonas humi]
MQEFKRRIEHHIEHVKNVGAHCATEETTKQALILPLLDILGFSPYDPTKVKAEYGADFPGVKASERVDYALFSNDIPVLFIEAKTYSADLTNHCPQLARYYNATPEVAVAAITNGREWRFFADLDNRNIMDREPFLVVDFASGAEDIAEQLERFHYDRLEPEALRALAEENVYLHAFKDAITSALRDCDLDFVKYVATRAGTQRTMTGKFLESVQPIIKQAVAQSVSSMVATSLSAPETISPTAPVEVVVDESASIVDPDNPNIITTVDEQNLYKVCCDILPGEDLQARDTESYFSIMHGGKTNRWLFRFWGDKKHPTIQFIVPLTDVHRAEVARAGLQTGTSDQILLDKPENLYRLVGIVGDALAYCKNNENFRRKGRDSDTE